MLIALIEFYAVGAFVTAIVIATTGSAEITYRGRGIPYPNLVASVLAGAVWPATLFKILVG
jgi:hypothetical protein